jgi:hypothetical protein
MWVPKPMLGDASRIGVSRKFHEKTEYRTLIVSIPTKALIYGGRR